MNYLRRMQAADAVFSCSSGASSNKLGPLNIDYIHLYRCDFKDLEFVFILLVIVWIVLLIDLLAKTASDYFTPTLASISLKWKLSNNLAGVTLVALANGAPDVFSSIIGLTTTRSADVSIGALLGGSLFVCTVVVGCISVLCPCKLSGLYFTRDAVFLLITVTRLAVLGAHKEVTLFSAMSLILIYILYLSVVLLTPWFETLAAKFLPTQKPLVSHSQIMGSTNIQTAYWFQSAENENENKNENENENEKIQNPNESKVSSLDDLDSVGPPVQVVNGYKFLILDEENDGDDGDDGGNNYVRSSSNNKLHGKIVIIEDEEEDDPINLTGGLLGTSFPGRINENYFQTYVSSFFSGNNNGNNDNGNNSNNTYNNEEHIEKQPCSNLAEKSTEKSTKKSNKSAENYSGNIMGKQKDRNKNLSPQSIEFEDTLRESLLSSIDNIESGDNDAEMGVAMNVEHKDTESRENREDRGDREDREDIEQNINSYSKPPDTINYPVKCSNLLILSLRRRFMRRIGVDWNETTKIEKCFIIFEYPFVIARDLTIPTLDSELWCRKHAAVQPLLCSLFLLFSFGGISSVLNYTPLMAFLGSVSILPSFLIYFLTHRNHPPTNEIFVQFWLFFGFIMCVSWIYLLAGELINCLTSVGEIFDIPPYYLGLTVLAWGNSVGDLFSNISVAKKGMGEMAVAGCYGGPVFNILIGMGVSMTYLCYRDYPKPYTLIIDKSASISIGFLCAILISTIFIAAFLRFRLNALIGYYLVSSYVLYTITQTIVVVTKSS